MNSTVELMNKGMMCLKKGLGDIESEEFISAIMRERFDYTDWRERNLFENVSVEDINAGAKMFEAEHPFNR